MFIKKVHQLCSGFQLAFSIMEVKNRGSRCTLFGIPSFTRSEGGSRSRLRVPEPKSCFVVGRVHDPSKVWRGGQKLPDLGSELWRQDVWAFLALTFMTGRRRDYCNANNGQRWCFLYGIYCQCQQTYRPKDRNDRIPQRMLLSSLKMIVTLREPKKWREDKLRNELLECGR